MLDIGNKPIVINEVIEFARIKHEGQKRKYTNTECIEHPLEVSKILSCLDAPLEVVAAAILHDTIEDTDATFEEIEKLFGTSVAKLVLEVTDVSKPEDGNRAARKQKDREHLAQSSIYGASIKLADMISNSRTIVKYDKNFAAVYLKEKEEVLKVLVHGHPILFQWAQDILDLSKMALEKR